jgi:hypothetical protein
VTGRDEVPDPQEIPVLRCQWVRDINPPDGCDEWILIPGCSTMLLTPTAGCTCDTLQSRLEYQIEHRKEVDGTVMALRRRCRDWSRAAEAAYAVLTGRRISGGGLHPQDLARAARRRDGSQTAR